MPAPFVTTPEHGGLRPVERTRALAGPVVLALVIAALGLLVAASTSLTTTASASAPVSGRSRWGGAAATAGPDQPGGTPASQPRANVRGVRVAVLRETFEQT